MAIDVLCLRPYEDFLRADSLPPPEWTIEYRDLSDPAVSGLMREVRALVIPAVGPPLSGDLFERSELQLVQVTGAGVDRLDRPTLECLGIPVCNVPGGSNTAMAEYVVTAALILLRRLGIDSHEIRAGRYRELRHALVEANLHGLDGLKVGIIGMGVIGRAVAGGFAGRGCQVCYHDPAPGLAARNPELGKPVAMEDLLRTSDVISVHVPLNDSTRNLVGDRELALTKKGVVLVQASRGGVVDEAAVARHLESGHIGGAAFDVYTTEPPARDNPLLMVSEEAGQRLLLTPHIAGVTRQAAQQLFRMAWANVSRALNGESPMHRLY
jgi:phosphoglycerate dehydrogenase-like enzyme